MSVAWLLQSGRIQCLKERKPRYLVFFQNVFHVRSPYMLLEHHFYSTVQRSSVLLIWDDGTVP